MRTLFKKKRLKFLAGCLDLTGPLWKLAAPRGAKRQGPRSILVIRLDHLGDILYATPIPQLLKENEAGSRITFLTSSVGAALLQNNPFVDETIVYDAPWFSRSGRTGNPNFGQVLRLLKEKRFDIALCLRGDFRENWLAYAAGIPERIGYGVTGGSFFLSQALPYGFGAHETEHTLDVLKAVGIEAAALRPKIYFSQEEEKRFSEKMRQWGLEDHRYAMAQLDAGTEAKQWPAENVDGFLATAAGRFAQTPLVFVGSDASTKLRVAEAMQKNPLLPWKNLIGETSLRELFWMIKQARLFVGHDSGPSHVAASFGIPTLFLYSGTNRWEEWRSLEESAEFLRHPVPCSPCHLTTCPVPGHPCMAGIEPEKAVRWMEERAHG